MNVMVCSWTRQTNTACLDLGLSAATGWFPFTLLTRWTEIDAFCVYPEIPDVPLCNVQSLLKSKTYLTFSFTWGNYMPFYFKSAYWGDSRVLGIYPKQPEILDTFSIIFHNLQAPPSFFVHIYLMDFLPWYNLSAGINNLITCSLWNLRYLLSPFPEHWLPW